MSSTITSARLLAKIQETYDAYVVAERLVATLQEKKDAYTVALKKHGDQLTNFQLELDGTTEMHWETSGEKIDEISCRIKETVLCQKQEQEKGAVLLREWAVAHRQKRAKLRAILDVRGRLLDLL
jgi:hypothetical protein